MDAKQKKRLALIGAAIAAVILLLLIGTLAVVNSVRASAMRERMNVLKLARDYGDAGDFDR